MWRAIAVALLLAAGACRCGKTDAERAKEERAEIEDRVRRSLALFPYRVVKLSVRSAGSPNRPKEIDTVWAVLEETRALPAKAVTAEQVAQEAVVYARLFAAAYSARETMMKVDEDEFPTLAATYLGAPLPPPYDPQLEHLALSALWLVLDAADQGDRIPGSSDYVFYEVSRAQPQPGWPEAARIAARLVRGLSFTAAKYHYAAEEELTDYVTSMEQVKVESLAAWGDGGKVSAEQTLHILRGAGYFGRGWNRMGLDRDEPAADDFEKGLRELEAIGVDNELTQWGWVLVHAKRKKYPEAAKKLDVLATSPNLDEPTRAELKSAAESMRTHGEGLPILLETRAMYIVATALLARAGGLEQVLTWLLGEEDGRKLYAPVAWFDHTRRQLARLTPKDATDATRSFLRSGKELILRTRTATAGP